MVQEIGPMAADEEKVGYVVQLPDGTYLSGGNPPLWSDEAFTVFPEYIDADAEADAHETSFLKRITYRFSDPVAEVSDATEEESPPAR
jgi:hypothetical protein